MTTNRFKKLSHSIYECKYHIVFCPKYRYKMLKGEVRNYIQEQTYNLCRQKDGVEILELNVQEDHVHLVVSIPPKYAVSEFVGFLKGKLALKTFNKYPILRKRYWGQHLWARGYCVSTVGIDEEMIRKYVKWQKKKEQESEINQGRLFD